jgi:hypothetical protein
MNLNNLFLGKQIDPRRVIVLRHRPHEPELNKVLGWLAVEEPDKFNAYQQTQSEKLEKAMKAMSGVGYIASFVGHEPGKALFIGLYSIGAFKTSYPQRILAGSSLCRDEKEVWDEGIHRGAIAHVCPVVRSCTDRFLRFVER